MDRTFSKPLEARQVEARARARQCGVKVAVVVEPRKYVTASQSHPGTLYTILRTPAGWACECEGYFHTGCCKHLGAVERRAAREGWPFGAIASLSRVARYFPLDLPGNIAKRGAVLAVTPAAAPAAALDALRERKRRALCDLYRPDHTAAD